MKTDYAMDEMQTTTASVLGVGDVTDNRMFWRQLIAELFGTFLLTSIGIASCITITPDFQTHVITIAITFGLIVATVVQAICHISGGHINPAVTIGLLFAGDIKFLKAIFYVVVQVLGASAGAAFIRLAIPDHIDDLGLTVPTEGIGDGQAILIEALITFLLLLVVQGVCDARRNDIKGSGPLAIGLCITACHAACIPYTGSSMNPARSFGPVLVTGYWDRHWIYWVGPITGAVISGLVYRFIFRVGKKSDAGSYDF